MIFLIANTCIESVQTYHLSWPVPGAPDVAKRVKDLLEKKGIPCLENATRGLDHGVFVPLMLVFPEADIPGMNKYTVFTDKKTKVYTPVTSNKSIINH